MYVLNLNSLMSQGDDAYLPELYGPTITISRKLTRSGGSFYYLGCYNQPVCPRVLVLSQRQMDCVICAGNGSCREV